MPVSGHEETEVKTCAGQFSGLISGVPIKKRRFPLNHSFLSLSGEQYSHTNETESLRKEHSSAPLGSTLTGSNTGIADAPIKKRRFPSIQVSSSSLEEPSLIPGENDASHKEDSSTSFGANENSAFEERETSSDLTNASFVQSKSSYLCTKFEEPDLVTQSSTDIVDSKEKSITSEKYEEELGKKNSELLFASKQSLSLDIGAEISNQNVQEKCKQESHAVLESTNLSLGSKERLFPAEASLDVDNSFLKTDKSKVSSLKLSLSKEDGSPKSRNDDAKANRENWDLNTTMDAWIEPGKVATSGKTSIHGLLITDNALMQKHVMCSARMEPTDSSEETRNEAFTISSRIYGQQHKNAYPRNLYLSSCLPKHTGESSRSFNQNSDCAIPTLNSSNVQAYSGDLNMASIRTVKSELLDENRNHDLNEAKPNPMGSLDGDSVKHEFVAHSNVDSIKYSEGSNVKFHNLEFIRSQPGHENNQERPKKTESISDQISKEKPEVSDNCSYLEKSVTLESLPTSTGTALPLKAICSTELSTSVGIVRHLENHASIEKGSVHEKASQRDCSGDSQVSPETVSIAVVDNEKSSSLGKKDSVINEENTVDAEGCRLKFKNEVPSDSHGRGKNGASEDDMMTLSTDILEYDSYGYDYDYESDAMDIEQYDEEDYDYEDGEVREPAKHSEAEDSICEVREVGGVVSTNYDSKQIEKEVLSVSYPTSSHFEENDNNNVNHDEINCANDGTEARSIDKSANVTDKTMCLQESLDAEKPVVGSQMRLLALSERKTVFNALETELLSDQGNNEMNEADAAQCADEVVKNLDIVRKTDSEIPKMEVSVNTDDANKNASNDGNQGRIKNLSRGARLLSPTKSTSIPSRGFPSQAGRDVSPEKFHHDKLHGRRDELYIDGPCRFSRERCQDILPRNSRLNFVRGRGRINSQIDTCRREWESDREFYSGPRQFRGSRHKFVSAVHAADPEYNDFVAHDGSFVGHRLGRKPLNNEGPVGHHMTLRRRSPGGRDNMQMGHIIPRTMSPSRCVEDDGSDFVSMRHRGNFMRGYPQEPLDLMVTRPQPFERVDGRYTQGGRSFIQRRGPQRTHSKSPIRSRSRSPSLWSFKRRSPRRSPDGFVGHPELAHRRPFYRDDRMRSPTRPVFHGERVAKRHVSPSYMSRPSNEMRDIGYGRGRGRGRGHPRSFMSNGNPSGRILFRKRFDASDPQDRADNDEYFEGHGERVVRRHVSPSYMSRPSNEIRDIGYGRGRGRGHGHPRSFMSNGNPSGRIMFRKRFDAADPQDRADNDEYFEGPVHSGRLLDGEGNGDERRFDESRGPVRSFRPPYNGGVDENFHLDSEDGSRQYRYCTQDSEFQERSSLRERDFGRCIKSRPANVPPRRTRNIKEQESNYRDSGQVGSSDGFDDISRMKRDRF
ncbi:hypothetical protein QN277_000937 [Acacia crassicarpa]|uniref:Uncharacterized protein n=1 Tax=Acacia crassicarpa TaxID=499986 RepID=A0AAE1TGA3_9FABA|nr:hypothetical protein QN277_000937 [Acacia crassicarpa]